MKGTVKFYNADRGFGFIAPETGGADVFVHVSNLDGGLDELAQGDAVTFETMIDPKKGKPHAVDVKLV